MQQFDHPHIIKLLGVCSQSPIKIVMELAEIGEVSNGVFCERNNCKLVFHCGSLTITKHDTNIY